jgi:hypothetical protein
MSSGCICTKRTKRWTEDGHCDACGLDLSESQIQTAVRLVLCANTDFVLWRNNIGVATYRDDDGIVSRVEYGIGNPGGADLIGSWRGRFAAIETKTARGRQSDAQRVFESVVKAKGGIYEIVRSEKQARDLLTRLMA